MNMEENTIPRRAYSLNQISQSAGIGLTKIYEEIRLGRLRAKKFGKRTLVTEAALEEWLNNLPDYETQPKQ